MVLCRFNYRSTAYMVKNGIYNFLNWFDERAWYPLGRSVGGTVYPGLMLTSGSIHYVLHTFNIPVHIRDICVFLAPTFRYGFKCPIVFVSMQVTWLRGDNWSMCKVLDGCVKKLQFALLCKTLCHCKWCAICLNITSLTGHFTV
jgi:hypothetical protein